MGEPWEAGTPDWSGSRTSRPARQLTGRKHILSLLVENRPGVLARIAGLFSRRGFNIDTLAVGPTEDPDISRITLTLDGAVHPIDQVTKQLHKLVNVIKIRDMEPGATIAREMALFRVTAAVENRGEIMQFAEIFGAKIVDVSRRTLTIEITGTPGQDRLLRAHGPPARPDRDGAHGRGRDHQVAPRRLGRRGRDRAAAATRRRADLARAALARAASRGALVSRVTALGRRSMTRRGGVRARGCAGDRWFCWEQPDRDGFALAGLGSAHEVVSRGPRRASPTSSPTAPR